jgi:midasin (ATPase involved in ribosome maturation)
MDKNSTEYKKLYSLYNSMSYQGNKPLINYRTLGRIEYLTEIKYVLDLKNEIDKDFKIYADLNEEQKLEIENKIIAENPNIDKKSSEFKNIFDERRPLEKVYKNLIDVVGSYVFTGDNFIKMILILHRIRANIPVIMMGETGCGKTSLIRIISELKMNEMKILNNHAGITDDGILQFMIKYEFIEGYNEELTKEEKENLLEEELLQARGGDDGFNPYFFDPDKKPELLPPESGKEEEKKTA